MRSVKPHHGYRLDNERRKRPALGSSTASNDDSPGNYSHEKAHAGSSRLLFGQMPDVRSSTRKTNTASEALVRLAVDRRRDCRSVQSDRKRKKKIKRFVVKLTTTLCFSQSSVGGKTEMPCAR